MVTKTRIVSTILKIKHAFEAKGFRTKFLYIGRETWVALRAEIKNPVFNSHELTELEIVIVNRPKWLAVGVVL